MAESNKYLICLDNGGTYIKGILYTVEGKQIAVSKHHTHIISPKSDWVEYDQDELWEANALCIRNLIKTAEIDPVEIMVIGICGQGGGFYAIDENRKGIRNAIASSDRRAFSIATAWRESGLSDELYPFIYRYPLSGHLSTLLAWLKQNEPENYHRIKWLFSMKDYLIYRLTDEIVAGYDCFSTSGLLNLKTMKFDRDVSEKMGIEDAVDKCGRLVWGTEVCGYVTEKAAELCGCLPGTPVAAGAHDVNASAVAIKATDVEHPFIITGTHAINGYISEIPVLNKIVRNNELFAYPGKYLIEEGYPSSSATLDWAISVLFDTDKDPKFFYNGIDKIVQEFQADFSDCYFLPFLRGQRDDPMIRGTWINLNPDTTKEEMLRAVYEGVVFSHMIQIGYLFSTQETPNTFEMAGGATYSNVWVQMFADALNANIEVLNEKEMGTKGVAILSSVARGFYKSVEEAIDHMGATSLLIKPDKKKHSFYKQRYKKFVEYVNMLKSK